MITPGRTVKDVEITKSSDTDHVFKELGQAGDLRQKMLQRE